MPEVSRRILVTGCWGSGYLSLAKTLSSHLNLDLVSWLSQKNVVGLKTYSDHVTAHYQTLEKLNTYNCVFYSKVFTEVEGFLLPLAPISKDITAVIHVERNLQSLSNAVGTTLENTKLNLYKSRSLLVTSCEEAGVPLRTFTYTGRPEELLPEIDAFLISLTSDNTFEVKKPEHEQEIQCSVFECDTCVVEEMLNYLYLNGVSPERIQPHWDTWIGVYFTPPTDSDKWTKEEFQKIYNLLEKHPNVMKVDIPEKMRDGQSRSNG